MSNDRVLSTPPTNAPVVSTRRRFLTNAAGVAAGGTVLALATIPPTPASATPAGALDPVFGLIEAHQRATRALEDNIHRYCELEKTLPKEATRSSINSWEEKIVETDAPEWIAAARALDAAHDYETDAACELLVVPSTMAGVIALLTYATSAARADDWPTGLVEDDGKRDHSWEFFAMRNCREALESLAVAS